MRRMRRMRIKSRRFPKIFIFLPAVIVVTLTVLLLIDARVRPILRTLAVDQARTLAVEAIDQQVMEYITGSQEGEGTYLTVSKDDSGKVISIESNASQINQAKSQINLAVTQCLQTMGERTVSIPLGSLSGFTLFYGRGPEVHIKLTMTGHSTANITEDFSAAGINQTLHRVLLNISAEVHIALPGYTKSEQISTDFVLSQTVIVGDIPMVYASGGTE